MHCVRSPLFRSTSPWILASVAAGQSNVLVVVADDLGVEQLAAYGEGTDVANTPTIDGLAQNGVLFRNAYSAPQCTPTRATLQTGRYGFRTAVGGLIHNNGPGLSHDELIVPELLDLGTGGAYAHALFGKWHLATEATGGAASVNLAGWSHFEGVEPGSFPAYDDWLKNTNGTLEWQTSYVTSTQVDDSLAWIGQQVEPWVVFLWFVAPHVPLHAPPDDLHTEDLDDIGTPEENPRPYFRAMVEAMDTELGRLLDGLGPALDDTVVMFLADNGTQGLVVPLPYDKTKAKGTVYELGINVPFLVAGPPVVDPGRESDAFVSTVDVFATIAELTGVEVSEVVPEETVLDSISVVPYLTSAAQPTLRPFAYAERFSPNAPGAPTDHRRAVRDVRYKLIRRLGSPDELYDLVSDPLETENLLDGILTVDEQMAFDTLVHQLDALLPPWPAAVHPYGCGVNPEGSLVSSDPEPLIGSTFQFSVDNPLGASTPGDTATLVIAAESELGFPCGTLFPGFGMAGFGATGEKLVGLDGSTFLPGGEWQPGKPVVFEIVVPNNPALNAVAIYVQAALLGDSTSPVPVGLSNAVRVQFGL